MKQALCWQSKTTPMELRSMLKTLGENYPIEQDGKKGLQISFEKCDEAGLLEVQRQGESVTIRYCMPAQAARAVGALLAKLPSRRKPYREHTSFTLFGIMLDCSRNAVSTVDQMKLWMQRLALLGYNMVMLYTEDTYQLEGEPYFGYQRGAYSKTELKAIDKYASKLNIEVIPCIQTLGHLAQILKHRAYFPVKDTGSVMLVGEPKTYELIEKMVSHWRNVCRTDRIHIGMDETHDLGRGRYLKLNGYRNAFDLFNEHLDKVVKICKRHAFKPMIWSDMYFRLGSQTGTYYDPDTVIPKDVVNKIPKDAELVYWDYYHNDKAFYLDWIERHRKMGKEPPVGSGIWTWGRYWHDRRLTEANAGACIDACLEANIKEIFFTQWGDNGAFCDHDSAFAGMTWCADKAYGTESPAATTLEKRFAAVCGGSYKAHELASDIHGGVNGYEPNLWDDPFFETYFRSQMQDNPKRMAEIAAGFQSLARKLKKHTHDKAVGDLQHAYLLASTFAARYALSADLLRAYRKKDTQALARIRRRIPQVVNKIAALEESFRNMWLRHNKPEGLETIQGRLGMLEVRYREMRRRLLEYMQGERKSLAELDVKCPPK